MQCNTRWSGPHLGPRCLAPAIVQQPASRPKIWCAIAVMVRVVVVPCTDHLALLNITEAGLGNARFAHMSYQCTIQAWLSFRVDVSGALGKAAEDSLLPFLWCTLTSRPLPSDPCSSSSSAAACLLSMTYVKFMLVSKHTVTTRKPSCRPEPGTTVDTRDTKSYKTRYTFVHSVRE